LPRKHREWGKKTVPSKSLKLPERLVSKTIGTTTNIVVNGVRIVEGAPYTDSTSMLKEQMEKLDNMELVDDNNSTCNKSVNNKSIA
jgi:hypothetical protein